jgi:hypothetical protein
MKMKMKMKILKLLIALMFPVLLFAQSGGTDNFQSKPNYVEIDSLKENSAGTYKFVVWNETTSLLEFVNGTDQTESNEGSLTVLSGGANSSYIHSNTTGSTDVVINGGDNITVTESGNTISIAASGGGFSGARITRSTSFTITTSSNYITWDTEIYDTESYFNSASNSIAFIVPATGFYRISFHCNVFSMGFSTQLAVTSYLYSALDGMLTGTSQNYYSISYTYNALTIPPMIYYLTADDAIRIQILANVSGLALVAGNQNGAYFEIEKL